MDFYTMILLLVNNHDIQETCTLTFKISSGVLSRLCKILFFFTFDGAFLSVEDIPFSRGYYMTLDVASIEII